MGASEERELSVRLSLLLLTLSMAACTGHERAALGDVYQKALLLQRQDEPRQALALADQGLNRAPEERNSDYYWKFRFLKAEVLLVEGDPAAASVLIDGQIPPIAGADELMARQRLDRGWAESSIPDFPKSLISYQQALRFARQAGSQSLITEIQLRQGVSLLRLGNAPAAEEVFLEGLAGARREGDSYFEACALGDLALLRMNNARYDEAIDRFQQALPLFEKIPSRRLIARTLDNLGYCELQLGGTEKALRLFKQAGRRAHDAGLWRDQQVSLGRIGDCYYDNGDLQNALVYYHRALNMARRTQEKFWIANWLCDLATTSMDMGDFRRAEDYNNQALALQQQMQNPVERLYPLLNAARLAASTKSNDEAQSRYRSILGAAKAQSGIRDPEMILEARAGLARLLVKAGRPAEAEAQWRKTLALVNSTRSALTHDEHRLTYLSSLIRFYQDYVDFLAVHGHNAEALRVAESSRARLLSERLRGNDRPPVPVTVAQLETLARRSRTIFLSYWIAPQRSFLWMITPAGLTRFTLPAQAKITRQVEAYRRSIDNLGDPLVSGSPSGHELYEVLLAPARSLIPRGSNVAIAPDGALYDLNFGTIPVPLPSPHYWIEDVTISVVPSLSTLAGHLTPARPPRPSLLLIGDPVSADPDRFPRLLNAKDEIEEIQEQFPSAGKLVLTDASAEPGAYAAARPRRFSFIHFAAHATSNREDPLDSAIILSPHQENYKLYAREVDHLPIRADLVTISACRSAGARAYAGEGLVGFAWAFLRAGARHVIAGLWEVDDQSTAQLMARLYAGLRHGSSPAAALRDAQRAMIGSKSAFHKPYYWAPFEVFADSLRLRIR
ncbi:MAG TPA: CHAT domain-containing tetratricopeptide repeat protein [Terriglobia bacterium]|nr:CHAT domain-containing tetratricopeptide repeat protein [Terriglobia bacterium]